MPPLSARDHSARCTPRAGFALWLYHRFNLSSRDIEDLMAERGIAVSYESVRLWCIKFGRHYTRRLRRRHQGYGDTFFVDEVFVRIQGKQHSHQPTRVRERGMRRFKSVHQAQRFLSTHAAVYNLFNLGRHLISAKHYRIFRARSLPLRKVNLSVPSRLNRMLGSWTKSTELQQDSPDNYGEFSK
jgi:transposase-like protein